MGHHPRIETVPRIGDAMTPDQDLSARLAELPSHWADTAPKPHYRGEELLLIVYADPGSNGWYYRERKPDSVTAYVRIDLHERAVQAAVAKAVEAEREACADLAVNRHWHWGELGNACLVDDDVSACADIAAAIRLRGVAG